MATEIKKFECVVPGTKNVVSLKATKYITSNCPVDRFVVRGRVQGSDLKVRISGNNHSGWGGFLTVNDLICATVKSSKTSAKAFQKMMTTFGKVTSK